MWLPITFAKAVRRHWGSIVTGGALIGGLGIWQATGHRVPTSVYWFIGLVGLAVAFYRAWRDEHLNYQRELARNAKPDLRGEMRHGLIDYLSYEDHLGQVTTKLTESQVLVNIFVVNHREASATICSYKLRIESGGLIFGGERLAIQDGSYIGTEDAFGQAPPQMILDFHKVLSTSPLTRGLGKEGWLRFRVDRLPPRDFDADRVSLTIFDAFGDAHILESPGQIRFGLWQLKVGR